MIIKIGESESKFWQFSKPHDSDVVRNGNGAATNRDRPHCFPHVCIPMNSSAMQSTGASSAPLASLETSLNKIFLSVGDFLDFNLRTSSLFFSSPSLAHCSGLDTFSRKPEDTARRTLDSSLQNFHASCDALEIQIVPSYLTLLMRIVRNRCCAEKSSCWQIHQRKKSRRKWKKSWSNKKKSHL